MRRVVNGPDVGASADTIKQDPGFAAAVAGALPAGLADSIAQVPTLSAQAQAASLAAGVYPAAYASTLPQGVTALSALGVGTGSGGTPGTYAGGVSGGPTGFAWQYVIGSDGKVASYAITSPGLSTATTAPTLSYPSGGLTGAAVPVASVSTLIASQKTYWVASADGLVLSLYANNAGASVTAPIGGTQVKLASGLAGYPLPMAAYSLATATGWLRDILLFGAVDTTKVYYLKYIRYHDSGNNVFVQINRVDADGSSNDTNICSLTLASATYVGRTWLYLAPQSSSGVWAMVALDVPTGSPTSAIVTGTPSTTVLQASCLRLVTQAATIDAANKAATLREYGLFEAPAVISRGNVDVLAARVKDLRLFGVDKARKHYVKYLNYLDSGTTRLLVEVWGVDADGTSNPVLAGQRSIGSGASLTGVNVVPLTDAAGAAVGYMIVDFGDGVTPITLPTSPGTYATTGIKRDRLQGDASLLAWIARAQVTSPGTRKPFRDDMTNDELRKFVKRLEIWNGVRGHDYIISRVKKASDFTRLQIADLTAGITPVCSFTITNPNLASLPTRIKAFFNENSGQVALKTGIYAVLEVDWSQWTSGDKSFTALTDAGIHPDQVHDTAEAGAFMADEGAEERITVGSDAGADFAALPAALLSLYRDNNVGPVADNGPFYKQTAVATTPRRRQEVQLLTSGEAAQTVGGVTYPDCFGANGEFGVDWMQLRGRGRRSTLIYNTGDNPTLQLCASHRLADVAILNTSSVVGGSDAGHYCAHVDPAAFAMDDMPSVRVQVDWRNVDLIGGAAQSKRLFGGGVYGGQRIRLRSVRAKSLNPAYATFPYLFHSTAATRSLRPALVELIDVSASTPATPHAVFQSLGAQVEHAVVLEGSDDLHVRLEVVGDFADLARRRHDWSLTGRHDGAVNPYDAGMLVLATTPGAAVSGTAAALIFGAVDELGRGSKCINGTAYTLGARLGDCSSANKALTIAGQTFTFTADYTAQSNATIISAINAAITSNPVASVNISMEDHPRLGFTRTMRNTSGTTIGNPAAAGPGRGVFVKRTGIGTIAAAADGDEIFGLATRPILDGALGDVLIARRFFVGFVAGAYSMTGSNFAPTTGKFGVTTGGAFSAGATTKIGTVDADGLVRLL